MTIQKMKRMASVCLVFAAMAMATACNDDLSDILPDFGSGDSTQNPWDSAGCGNGGNDTLGGGGNGGNDTLGGGNGNGGNDSMGGYDSSGNGGMDSVFRRRY